MTITKFLLLLASLGAILFLTGCATVNPTTGVPDKVYEGVVYERPRQGERMALDVYVPQRPDPRSGVAGPVAEPPPLVIWFHGGGWRYGHRKLYFLTRRLTEQGLWDPLESTCRHASLSIL